MKKVNREYEAFKKKFSEETGVTDEFTIVELMKKLRRAEGKLHRLFEKDCNENSTEERDLNEEELMLHVENLMKKYKTITIRFNNDPRGGAIRFIFNKTGWYNTMGSDVAVNW